MWIQFLYSFFGNSFKNSLSKFLLKNNNFDEIFDEHSKTSEDKESFIDAQMKSFYLIHFNEFSASLRNLLKCQSFDYFDSGSWMNIGNSFLCKVLSNSKFNPNNKSSLSQVQSKSIFNSQKLNHQSSIGEKLKNELVDFEDLKTSDFEIVNVEDLVLKIEKSNIYRDFTIEKQFSEDSMLSLSCLRR